MSQDPILRQRLDAAQERRDAFLASEVERNEAEASTRRREDPKPEKSEVTESPMPAEPTNPENDGVPEVAEDDGEDLGHVPKRARVDSGRTDTTKKDGEVLGGSMEEVPVESADPARVGRDEDEEPHTKRMRTQALSVVKGETKTRASWADLADAEDVERCNHSRLQRDGCLRIFDSRNQLFAGACPVSHLGHGTRSEADAHGLSCADDGSPGNLQKEDVSKQPRPETSDRRSTGRYDVCEVFSPARVSLAAEKRSLREGWSLDLSQTCSITGREWNCLLQSDR